MIDPIYLKAYGGSAYITKTEGSMQYRPKVHLFFGGGLFLVLAISVVMNLSSGLTFASTVLESLGKIRPVEYGMYFAFWYWLARGQQTTFRSTFTSLNLRGSKS